MITDTTKATRKKRTEKKIHQSFQAVEKIYNEKKKNDRGFRLPLYLIDRLEKNPHVCELIVCGILTFDDYLTLELKHIILLKNPYILKALTEKHIAIDKIKTLTTDEERQLYEIIKDASFDVAEFLSLSNENRITAIESIKTIRVISDMLRLPETLEANSPTSYSGTESTGSRSPASSSSRLSEYLSDNDTEKLKL